MRLNFFGRATCMYNNYLKEIDRFILSTTRQKFFLITFLKTVGVGATSRIQRKLTHILLLNWPKT